MLSPALLHVVDRLITAVMTLVHAVAPSASTPTLPEVAARTLLVRLTELATRLIRIDAFGIRALAQPKPATQVPALSAPIARPSRPTQPRAAPSLPRRPGWLLAALPEIAPAVAADIRALLADPAIVTLFDRAPSLHRTLRPLLRALGLDAAPPIPAPPHPPTSTTKPPGAPPPSASPPPRTSNPPILATASKLARPNTQPFHAIFIS